MFGAMLEATPPAAQECTELGFIWGNTLVLHMLCNLNLASQGEGTEKKKKKRLLYGINMLYVPLSHAISLHRCAGIFIPSRNV